MKYYGLVVNSILIYSIGIICVKEQILSQIPKLEEETNNIFQKNYQER